MARLLTALDPIGSAPRRTAWQTATLLLYCAVVGFGIRQHLPWADEWQAWMLAHEVSLPNLLIHSLHYEGTPGLWHSLLKLLQFCSLTFTAARWIAGCIAAAGIAVLLAWSPLPRIIHLLLPFSFFLAYQDAVIARSYVLFAPLVFVAAALLRSARPRPLLLALVLGLTANVSLHGLLASGGLAMVAMVRFRIRWRQVEPFSHRSRGASVSLCGPSLKKGPVERILARYRSRKTALEPRSGHLRAAMLILTAFWLLAAVTMAPARDVDFSAGNNVWRSLAKVENQLGIEAPTPPAISALPMAGLPRSPLPVHSGKEKGLHKAERALAVITYPLSAYRGLALLLFVLILIQAGMQTTAARRSQAETTGGPLGLLGLLPYLLFFLVFTSMYLEPRHAGTVFTMFVVSAWLSWPARLGLMGGRLLLERVTAAVFAVVLALQLPWTWHALASEHRQVYSAGKMTAEYLKEHGAGQGSGGSAPAKPVAGFYYYSLEPLAYFDRNIYLNQPPHRYWLWSTRMRSYASAQEVLAAHPAFIVLGGNQPGPDYEITRDWFANTPPEPGVRLGDAFFLGEYFRRHGYRETHLFCGHSWMRASYAEQICESVLEPEPASDGKFTQVPTVR